MEQRQVCICTICARNCGKTTGFEYIYSSCVCVCVCVWVCARARVCVCVRACVPACMRVCVRACVCVWQRCVGLLVRLRKRSNVYGWEEPACAHRAALYLYACTIKCTSFMLLSVHVLISCSCVCMCVCVS